MGRPLFHYVYNSSGQRVKKDNSTNKVFHYDMAGQLIAETDAAGNLIKAYVWLHGQPLAQIDASGAVYYYHNDHLGTPQGMTDQAAAVVWAADYLPFGTVDVTVGTVKNDLRFAGQYYDSETGLHYNYHRYYDPKLGRYLRADPLNLSTVKHFSRTNMGTGKINVKAYYIDKTTNPSHLSLYAYCANNPIMFMDPTGLLTKDGVMKLIKMGKACKECKKISDNPNNISDAACDKCCQALAKVMTPGRQWHPWYVNCMFVLCEDMGV